MAPINLTCLETSTWWQRATEQRHGQEYRTSRAVQLPKARAMDTLEEEVRAVPSSFITSRGLCEATSEHATILYGPRLRGDSPSTGITEDELADYDSVVTKFNEQISRTLGVLHIVELVP